MGVKRSQRKVASTPRLPRICEGQGRGRVTPFHTASLGRGRVTIGRGRGSCRLIQLGWSGDGVTLSHTASLQQGEPYP